MSSPRSTNSDSVRIQIPDCHINTFLNQTKNGKDWKSQRLSIKNILFHIGLYPNGQGKKYAGNIQFIVEPDKDIYKDCGIDYVVVYCQIYCPTLGIMFKGTKSLYKKTDILQLQLPKEKHQDIIIKNGIMFICHIEVLKIIYKSQSSVSGLTRKLSTSLKKKKRSRSSASSRSLGSLDSIASDVFIPRTFHSKSSVNIEMVIDDKMVHPVYSEDINNMWCLSVIRNILSTKTKKSRTEGRQLVINMIRLPHYDIRSVEVDYTVEIQSGQCIPVHIYGRNVLLSYKKTTETLNLFEVSKLDEFGGIYKLKMNIKIIRLYKDIGKNGKGREITDSWSMFGIERVEFQAETIKCNIDGQQHGTLTAYEPDDMKYSQHSTTNSTDIVENVSVKSSKRSADRIHRKASVPTNSSGTSNIAARTSITSLIDSPLQHISENKIEEVAIQHWDELQQNDDNKQPESKQSQHEIKTDDNLFTKKFAHWLCEDVKLGQYLKNFQAKEWNYITMLKNFKDGTLVSVGIKNEQHRILILNEVKKFVKGQENFQQLMQKNPILLKFEILFKDNGIWTVEELQRIKSKNDLCMIINDADMLSDVWDIITNLESILDELQRKKKLQLQVNQIQRKQSQFLKDVRNHCTDLMNVYTQLQSEDKKSFDQIQQVGSMLNEVFKEFKNQNDNYKSHRPSVSVSITSTPSGPTDVFNNSHLNNSNTDKDHGIVTNPNLNNSNTDKDHGIVTDKYPAAEDIINQLNSITN